MNGAKERGVPHPPTDPLLHKEAEVLIIGGGAVGVQCALQLARRRGSGAGIVIVEKGAFPNGSSLRSAAAFRTAFVHPTNIALATAGVNFLRNFAAETGSATTVAAFRGYLYPRYTHHGELTARQRVVAARAAGAKAELLDAKEAMRRYPYLQNEGLRAAAFYEDAGFAVPDAIVKGVLEAAKQLGVTAYANTEVLRVGRAPCDVESEAGRQTSWFRQNCWYIETSRGVIETPTVVIAAGAWSQRVAQKFSSHLPIWPIRRHLYYAAARTGLYSADEWRNMPFICGDKGSYTRPESIVNGADFKAEDMKLMMGWAAMPNALEPKDYLDPHFEDVAQDQLGGEFFHRDYVKMRPGADGTASIEKLGFGRRMLVENATFLPRLLAEDVGIPHQSSGLYEMTGDHMPIIDFDPDFRTPGRRRLAFCAGFNGHGVMMSAGAGMVLAELLTEGRIVSIPHPERLAFDRDYTGHWDPTTI